MKIAFLVNIISPYRRPVFERLADTEGWQLRVFVNAENEYDRSWKVKTNGLDVVRSRSLGIRRKVVSHEPIYFEQMITLHLPWGLWGDLARFQPDVVISSELGPRSMIAAAYCRLHRIPLVIWAYQSRVSASQGNRRLMIRRHLLKQAAIAVGMGVQAREVLRGWGVPDERIVDALNSADHDTLLKRLKLTDTTDRSKTLKQQWGDQRRLAVVVGRLIPLKGVDRILEAWASLPDKVRSAWRLVFLGEGPLSKLIDQMNDPGIQQAGHVAPDEMADWYAASDLHIFPTLGDVWGLVVNEAMACGVPTLCSIHAGCSDDMITHGKDGLLYDPTDQAATVVALHDALTRPDLPALGHAAQETAKRFTLNNLADSFRNAVDQATSPSFNIPTTV